MADLSPTAANVKMVTPTEQSSTTAPFQGIIGEAVTQFDQLYLDSTTSKYMKAKSSGTLAQATVVGVALASGSTDQRIAIMPTEGNINPGCTVAIGTEYYLSSNAGKVCLWSDLASTNYVTRLAIADTTANLRYKVNNTGIQKA